MTQPSCYAVIRTDAVFRETEAVWCVGLTSTKRKQRTEQKEKKTKKTQRHLAVQVQREVSPQKRKRKKCQLYCRCLGRQGLDLLKLETKIETKILK